MQTSAEEMKTFIGLTIIMGYHRLPAIRDYWKEAKDLNVAAVSVTMTNRRYEILRKCLHFSDNQVQPEKQIHHMTEHSKCENSLATSMHYFWQLMN